MASESHFLVVFQDCYDILLAMMPFVTFMLFGVKFFTTLEIAAFRSLLGSTDAIVSGSTALRFFTRECFEHSDLDVYCTLPRSFALGLFFLSSGYKFVRGVRQAGDLVSDFARVWDFRNSAGVTIQLLVTPGSRFTAIRTSTPPAS
ncbi:hypothetical protein D9757_010486 [Collybiopsis confluens]|uniref:Uncharacterized protein n=1 Tax=Collybiopsis confluens TaxID=2823264 RepID=A0A8H5GYV7_9AGAR|nr:hypothetical protein D9757_010486 [Collybiopsis confluens]